MKKATVKQLAARKKFVAMVKSKAAKKQVKPVKAMKKLPGRKMNKAMKGGY